MRDPETQSEVDMTVFLIFDRSNAIYERTGRVIDAFCAHCYTDIPEISLNEELDEARLHQLILVSMNIKW